MRTLFAIFLLSLYSTITISDERRGLHVGLEFGQDKIDLDYSGVQRETRLSRLGVLWYEKLSPSIVGGVELGYLEFTQYSNPIPAGQTGSGEYIGLNLAFLLIETTHFDLLTRLDYRYNDARHSLDDQKINWDWHEGSIGIYSTFKFSNAISLTLGASALAIDGRESATGTITEAQPFKADEPFSGHVGLDLGLDHAGTIGIEISTGSLRGGRLSFQRIF